MQRDGWYSTALSADDLESPAAIGRRAAERAASRLQPRSIATGEVPVLFAAEIARSLVGHLLAAVSGGALYRKASFLVDSAGSSCSRTGSPIDELPFLPRGFRSAAFDSEGVATRESTWCADGVLQRYVLGSYSARKLGLADHRQCRWRAQPAVAANAGGFDGMLRGMGRGLLVTELMGQGVNPVTGDYSRGAAGFWIEDGVDRLSGRRHHHRRQPAADVRRDRGGRQRCRSALAHPHGFDPGRPDDGGRDRLTSRNLTPGPAPSTLHMGAVGAST